MQKKRLLTQMTNEELLNWEKDCQERLDFYQRVVQDDQLANENYLYVKDAQAEKASRGL